jgi:hypothetical protein
MANLFGEDAEAKPWRQNTFEDARLAFQGKRDEPASELGNFGVIDRGGAAHVPSLPLVVDPERGTPLG